MHLSWIIGLSAVLVISLVNGQETETSTVIPESQVNENLTIFTINGTRPDISENGTAYRPIVPVDLESTLKPEDDDGKPDEKPTVTEIPTEENKRERPAEERRKRPVDNSADELFTDEKRKKLAEEKDEDTEWRDSNEKDKKVDDDTQDESENKFEGKSDEITFEHIDFVQLRLKHLALSTPNNITVLKEIQAKEFKKNPLYKDAWTEAASFFKSTKKEELFQDSPANSTARTVPEDYHIAIIAYSLQLPEMFAQFNQETREICGGKNIDDYHYKSYFKLLLLAVQTLGKEPKFQSQNRFLYRGASLPYGLEIGQVLAFQQFTSTSTALKTAENFASKTLLEMDGPFHGTTMSMKHHSKYSGKDEVLLSPFQVYHVDSKHVGSYYTRYVLKPNNFKMNGEQCGFEPQTPDEMTTAATTESIVSSTKVSTNNKGTRKGKELKQRGASDKLSLNIALIVVTTFMSYLS